MRGRTLGLVFVFVVGAGCAHKDPEVEALTQKVNAEQQQIEALQVQNAKLKDSIPEQPQNAGSPVAPSQVQATEAVVQDAVKPDPVVQVREAIDAFMQDRGSDVLHYSAPNATFLSYEVTDVLKTGSLMWPYRAQVLIHWTSEPDETEKELNITNPQGTEYPILNVNPESGQVSYGGSAR